MAKRIRLPDNTIGNFPDDMSDADIESVLQKQFPPENPQTSETLGEKGPETREIKDIFGGPKGLEKSFLRYGLQDPLIGLLNFGSRGATSVNNLRAKLGEKIGNALPEALQKHLPYSKGHQEATDFSQMLGIPENEKNWADTLAQFGSEVAPALVAPETEIPWVSNALMKLPAWGKYLKTALGNATTQGGIAATQSPENPGKAALEAGAITAPFAAAAQGVLSGNPMLRNISRALMAGGGATLGYMGAKGVGAPEPIADFTGLLGGILGGKGVNAKRRATEDVLRGVEGTNYQEPLEAAKRLNLSYLSPGEASGSPFAGGTQGSLGKTEPGAQILHEKGTQREGEIEQSIDEFLGKIFKPGKLTQDKEALYEVANPQKIPDHLLNEFKEDEVFMKALREVRTDPVYQKELKGYPENSIKYINQVKRKMDFMINNEKDFTKADIIRDTKNNMLDKLDEISPEYKQARQLSERELTRKNIEKAFDKKPMNAANFAKLLASKEQYGVWQNKFKRLQENTKDPEQIENMKSAQQQLEDMREVFHRLIPIPTAKTAEGLARKNASEGHSATQEAWRYFKQILSGEKYDKAAVELITNPKWADELEKLKEVTNKQKLMSAFHNIMGKAGAQAIAQE